jgi:hypothetical protein
VPAISSQTGREAETATVLARRFHPVTRTVLILSAIALVGTTTGVDAEDELAQVLSRCGEYVKGYGGQVSSLVATEHYRQEWSPEADLRIMKVTLTSEFALVRAGGAVEEWAGFRDVVEVNGKPVHDRNDRLQRLFVEGPPNVLEEALRIADEGARFNLGPVTRNFNVPTTAMFFLHPANQGRFRWRKTGEASTPDGTKLWELTFQEQSKPTVIRSSKGKNAPAKGRVWVNPLDGCVVQTEMLISGFARDVEESDATINVKYAVDTSLKIWLPARMNEEYKLLRHSQSPMSTRPTGLPLEVEVGRGATMTRITGVADYVGYRQFQTSVKVVPK